MADYEEDANVATREENVRLRDEKEAVEHQLADCEARYRESRHRENCLMITTKFALLVAVISVATVLVVVALSTKPSVNVEKVLVVCNSSQARSKEYCNGMLGGMQPQIREATYDDPDSPDLKAADVSIVGEDGGKEVLACSKGNVTNSNGENDFNDIESMNDTMTFEEVLSAVVEDAEKEGLACGKENVTDCDGENAFNDTESMHDGGAAITITKEPVIVGVVNEGILQVVSTAS